MSFSFNLDLLQKGQCPELEPMAVERTFEATAIQILKDIDEMQAEIKSLVGRDSSLPLPMAQLEDLERRLGKLTQGARKPFFGIAYYLEGKYEVGATLEEMQASVQSLIETSLTRKRKRKEGKLSNAKKRKTIQNLTLNLVTSSNISGSGFIPLNIIENDLISFLSTKEIHNLLLISKKHLTLLAHTKVLDQICSDPMTHIVKLSFVAGSFFKQLDLATNNLRDRGLIPLFQNCPNLERLDLTTNPYMTHESIKALATHCSNLQSLSLDMNEKISVLGIQALSKGCTNLTELYLYGGRYKLELLGIDPPFIEYFKQGQLKILFESCTKLRRLSVSQLGDQEVCALADNCTDLEELSILDSVIKESSISRLLQTCKKLKALNLSN